DVNCVDTVVYQVSTVVGPKWSSAIWCWPEFGRVIYQSRAVVTDNAGNSSNTAPIAVIVDNTAPTAGTLSFANLLDTGHADTTPRSEERRVGKDRRAHTDANGANKKGYQVSTDAGTNRTT